MLSSLYRGKPSHSHAPLLPCRAIPTGLKAKCFVIRSPRRYPSSHAASTRHILPSRAPAACNNSGTSAAHNRRRRIQRQPSRARRTPSSPATCSRRRHPVATWRAGRTSAPILALPQQLMVSRLSWCTSPRSSPSGSPQGVPVEDRRLICRYKLAAVRLVIHRHIHRQLRARNPAHIQPLVQVPGGAAAQQSGCSAPSAGRYPPSAGVVTFMVVSFDARCCSSPAPHVTRAHVAAIDALFVSPSGDDAAPPMRNIRRLIRVAVQRQTLRVADQLFRLPPSARQTLCAVRRSSVRPRPPSPDCRRPLKPAFFRLQLSVRFIGSTSCPSCRRGLLAPKLPPIAAPNNWIPPQPAPPLSASSAWVASISPAPLAGQIIRLFSSPSGGSGGSECLRVPLLWRGSG